MSTGIFIPVDRRDYRAYNRHIIIWNQNYGVTYDMYMHVDEKKLGEAVRYYRIKKGMPLEDVAAKANLSPRAVRALELGRGSTLKTILKVLKIIDEDSFIIDWIDKSNVKSPMEALRSSMKLTEKPKRVSRRIIGDE